MFEIRFWMRHLVLGLYWMHGYWSILPFKTTTRLIGKTYLLKRSYLFKHRCGRFCIISTLLNILISSSSPHTHPTQVPTPSSKNYAHWIKIALHIKTCRWKFGYEFSSRQTKSDIHWTTDAHDFLYHAVMEFTDFNIDIRSTLYCYANTLLSLSVHLSNC